MKRWSATLLVFAVCSAIVHADVTIVQKTTVEGGAAAAMGGNAPTPTVTTRIKGMKGRTDMDMGANSPIPTNISTITATRPFQAHITSASTSRSTHCFTLQHRIHR